MPIITPPAPLPLRKISWRAPFPAQVNRSGWTGRRKVVGLSGATAWTANGTFKTIVTEAKAKAWRGFFISLCGSENPFRLEATENIQTEAANPQVAAGANDGSTLPLQHLPASATVLFAGDLMTVPLPSGHERLVCLTAPLVSDASGQGTATFGPELGEVPVAGAVVEIGRPWGLMALTSDPPGWDVDVGQQYSFPVATEEAL